MPNLINRSLKALRNAWVRSLRAQVSCEHATIQEVGEFYTTGLIAFVLSNGFAVLLGVGLFLINPPTLWGVVIILIINFLMLGLCGYLLHKLIMITVSRFIQAQAHAYDHDEHIQASLQRREALSNIATPKKEIPPRPKL